MVFAIASEALHGVFNMNLNDVLCCLNQRRGANVLIPECIRQHHCRIWGTVGLVEVQIPLQGLLPQGWSRGQFWFGVKRIRHVRNVKCWDLGREFLYDSLGCDALETHLRGRGNLTSVLVILWEDIGEVQVVSRRSKCRVEPGSLAPRSRPG